MKPVAKLSNVLAVRCTPFKGERLFGVLESVNE